MGAVVENLSNRKLFCLLGILVVVQIFFFLIGGLIGELIYKWTVRISEEDCMNYV